MLRRFPLQTTGCSTQLGSSATYHLPEVTAVMSRVIFRLSGITMSVGGLYYHILGTSLSPLYNTAKVTNNASSQTKVRC